jgi:hypothetical protein
MNLSAHITVVILEGDSPSPSPPLSLPFSDKKVERDVNIGTKIDEIFSYLPPPLFFPGNTE